MKQNRDDWLIVLVGGPLFGALLHWKFEDSPGLVLSIATGFVVMGLIVVLRRVVGEQSWPRFLAVAFTAGVLTGLAVWWLVGRGTPWVFYAVPCGLLALVAGAFDRLTDRRAGKAD